MARKPKEIIVDKEWDTLSYRLRGLIGRVRVLNYAARSKAQGLPLSDVTRPIDQRLANLEARYIECITETKRLLAKEGN